MGSLEIALLILALVSAAWGIYELAALRSGRRKEERAKRVPASGRLWAPTLLLILCLCAAAFLYMNRRLEDLENKLLAEMSRVSERFEQSNDRLRAELGSLEERNNCFRSYKAEFVSLDPAAKTMELRVVAEPRYVTEGASVRLQLDDMELELEQTEGRSFEAVFPVAVESAYYSRDAVLVLIENGQARTQQMNIDLSLDWNVFPHAYHSGAWQVEDGRVTSVEYEAGIRENLYEVTGMYVELFRGGELLERKELIGPNQSEELYGDSYGEDWIYRVTFRLPESLPRSVLEEEESELYQYTVHLHYDDTAGLHHDSTKLILEVWEPTRLWKLEPDWENYWELTDDHWEVTNDAGEALYMQ